jgi:hypothetical protein
VQVVVEAGYGKFRQVGARVGMIARKLHAIVIRPRCSEQACGTGVVEMRIVEHDEAWVPKQVRPLIIVE